MDDIFKNELNGTIPVGKEVLDAYTSISTDVFFRVPAVITSEDIAKHSPHPVYHYIYSHQSTTSLTDLFLMPLWQILGKVRIRNSVTYMETFKSNHSFLDGW